MTLIAVVAWRTVPNAMVGWAILAFVVLIEVALHGRMRGRTPIAAMD